MYEVYTCTAFSVTSLEYFLLPPQRLYPLTSTFHFYFPSPTIDNNYLIFFLMELPLLDISYECNHTVIPGRCDCVLTTLRIRALSTRVDNDKYYTT